MGVRPSLVTLLAMMAFLLFDASSYAAKVVEVGAICKQTKTPAFCSNILNSKPGGAKGADLVTLAGYTIEVARGNITNTINLIKSLISSATDPSAKGHYQMCLTHFTYEDGALGDIEYTQQRMKSGDYQGVNVAAAAVITDVEDCIKGESPPNPPFHDPSSLPQFANVLEQVVDIILVLSNLLRQN